MTMVSIDVIPPAARRPSNARRETRRQSNHVPPLTSGCIDDIGVFAHDVRGPLANLSLLLEAIEDQSRGSSDDTLGALAAKALRSVERIDAMVAAMLTRSCGRRDQPLIHTRAVSLPDVVETAATLNQPFAARHGVRLHCFLTDPVCVIGDEDLLMRAVDNLLTNAIKFSPSGGLVACQLAVVGSEAVIRIEDEGPGLSSQDIARVFRPYAVLSAKAAGPLGTNGLGLSIVRGIAERHGGSVTAGNATHHTGAVFELRLPSSKSADGTTE